MNTQEMIDVLIRIQAHTRHDSAPHRIASNALRRLRGEDPATNLGVTVELEMQYDEYFTGMEKQNRVPLAFHAWKLQEGK